MNEREMKERHPDIWRAAYLRAMNDIIHCSHGCKDGSCSHGRRVAEMVGKMHAELFTMEKR